VSCHAFQARRTVTTAIVRTEHPSRRSVDVPQRPIRMLFTFAAALRPHSIILASCKPGCKPGFRPGLQPGFRQVRAGLRHAFDTLSTFLSKTWSRTCCINLGVRSSLGFKQVCSWLSTCFRHAFDLLPTCFRHAHASRKPGLQPGLQLARIMECGLYQLQYIVEAFFPPYGTFERYSSVSLYCSSSLITVDLIFRSISPS